MKTLRIIIIVLVVVIAVLLVGGLILPARLHIEESTIIGASEEVVFSQVNDFKNWTAWSPWEQEDTTIENTYMGQSSGVGAINCWEGSSGSGCQWIVESVPYEQIKTALVFSDGDTATGGWSFTRVDKNTHVYWFMDMELSYPIDRYTGLFIRGVIHKSFIDGLARLKTVAEEVESTISGLHGPIIVKDIEAMTYINISDSGTIEEMPEKLGAIYKEIYNYLGQQNTKPAGPPMAVYYKFNPATGYSFFNAGTPLTETIEASGNMIITQIHPFKAVMTTHYGSYGSLQGTYRDINSYAKEKDLMVKGSSIEIYHSDPVKEPDTSKWATDIIFPLK